MIWLYVDTIFQNAMITACALITHSIACPGLFAHEHLRFLDWALRGSPRDDGYVAVISINFQPHTDGTELILVHERLPAASRPVSVAGWDGILGKSLKHCANQAGSGQGA